MVWVRQKFIYAVAVMCGIGTSQFPEFAQQYKQRLGGAIEELGRVVSDFDRDATISGLSRSQALDLHQQSTAPLFQQRGRSMRAAIDRYETLLKQRDDFARRSSLTQPLVLAYSDGVTIAGALHDFSPAVPTTTDGLIWAASGFVLGAAVVYLAMALLGWFWRRSKALMRFRPSTSVPARTVVKARPSNER